MSFVVHRVSKSAARYTDAGGREKCAYCRFFMAPRACGKVIGPVSPQGWCKYFSRQVAQQYSGAGFSSGGGASFDQNFLSGSLGAGAVFTRASTGTYYDSAGVLRSAAINTPRFDYDPATLQLKGLLLEDASTNLALQSGNLSVAPWSLLNFTVAAPVVTGNNTTSPDGTTTAARIVYPAVSAAANGSVIYQSFTATAVPYTISLYLKGNVGGEQLYIALQDGASTWYRVRATLTTQWQRFAVTTSNLTAALWYLEIGTDLRDGGQTSTPAQTIYAWGAQVEASPYMSSHIPTTSVSVTRAVDLLSYPGAALTGYASPGGSWFTEIIPFGYRAGGGYPRVVYQMPASTSPGPVVLDGNVPAHAAQYDGVGLPITTNTTPYNAITRIATTATAAAGRVCMNGDVVASSALGGAYPGLLANGIGFFCSAGALTTNMAGYLRRVSYWPRVLSDAEMQQVTT